MDSFKIRVNSPEESARVQRELFRRGYEWIDCFNIPRNTEKHFLFINEGYITDGDDFNYFNNHLYREITIGDLFIGGDMCQMDKMREEIEGINNVLKAVNENVEALTGGLKSKEQVILNQVEIIKNQKQNIKHLNFLINRREERITVLEHLNKNQKESINLLTIGYRKTDGTIDLLKKENEAYDTRIAELEALIEEAGLEV